MNFRFDLLSNFSTLPVTWTAYIILYYITLYYIILYYIILILILYYIILYYIILYYINVIIIYYSFAELLCYKSMVARLNDNEW